jgi:serpin B
MMRGLKPYAGYASSADLEAVSLDYDGNELSMLIIVPDRGKFDAVEQQLSGPFVSQLIGQLGSAKVDLSLPRFEFEKALGLKDQLQGLGMTDVFIPGDADLSGIDDSRSLFVSAVLHKAFVKVNEAGTEAAAATAIVGDTSSAGPPPTPPVRLVVDRPFIFLIRDYATGAILFVGRVMEP